MPRFFVDAKGIPNTYVNCLTCYNEPANIPENGGSRAIGMGKFDHGSFKFHDGGLMGI